MRSWRKELLQNAKSMKHNENQKGCLIGVINFSGVQGYVANRCFENSREKKEKQWEGKRGRKKRERKRERQRGSDRARREERICRFTFILL